jgi:membrane protein implicated in regulation of membrane protease activity
MKRSDGFDARRLRSRGVCTWSTRMALTCAALLVLCGATLSAAGVAALLGTHAMLGPLNDSPVAAGLFAIIGLALLSVGVMVWRSYRRRSRPGNDLNMAPHLLKKRR